MGYLAGGTTSKFFGSGAGHRPLCDSVRPFIPAVELRGILDASNKKRATSTGPHFKANTLLQPSNLAVAYRLSDLIIRKSDDVHAQLLLIYAPHFSDGVTKLLQYFSKTGEGRELTV